MFSIKYSNQAAKFIKKSEKETSQRIIKKLEELKKNPFPHDMKSIKGSDEKFYRVRVGDFRILYEVDKKNNLIGIIKIDKRSKVYKK